MTDLATSLVPLPVVIPLAFAGAMLAVSHLLPSRVPDVLAILVALGVAGLCAFLAVQSGSGTLVYWFGGWTPRPDVVLGIGFGVDPASAGIGSFIGLLFAATFVFAWGYFEEIHATFQVLMLLFLAAMEGFCLTRDLFNMFVWFEVMSVAAFALTAYRLEKSALSGALNFTVTNSLASCFMLGGVGLLYGRTGVLDFEALGHAVARVGADPVVIGGFCVLATALLIKAAIVPFQFWLSDAHAVAPSPISVIFSGAMVPLGLFGFSKLTFQVFGHSDDALFLVRGVLLVLGAVTAVVGGLMAWKQRHLKRMLAFSTIAHIGVMLTGVAALAPAGLAGLLAYMVGHGLVKGALFMLVGILLATRASVDELDLRGLGKGIGPAGVATAFAGLLLGGVPLGILHGGTELIHGASLPVSMLVVAASLFGTAMTGACVLRATGRIYLGLGPEPGDEAQAPSEEEQEKADRPLWLMLGPCVFLLGLALVPSHLAQEVAARAAPLFAAAPAMAVSLPEPSPLESVLPWISIGLALLIAGLALFRERLPKAVVGPRDALIRPVFAGLNQLHSGLINDYVLWVALGFALFCLSYSFR